MKMVTASLLIILCLAGCATNGVDSPTPVAWREVVTGMTREEVYRLVGEPSGMLDAAKEATLRKEFSNAPWDWWHLADPHGKLWVLGVTYDGNGRVTCVLSGPLEASWQVAPQQEQDPFKTIINSDRAIESNPKNLQAYLDRGLAKYVTGDSRGALADYNRALELDPNNVGAYVGRGRAREGDFDGAIADYSRAIELKPDCEDAYFRRAYAKYSKGQRDDAIADFTCAIKLNPQDAANYLGRATTKNAKGDWDGAILDYDQFIKLSPKDGRGWTGRGAMRKAKGDLDGALEDYNRALQIAGNTYTYYERGTVHLAKGDPDEAIKDFDRSIEVNPKLGWVYFRRGVAKQAKGDMGGALADYARALEFRFDEECRVLVWLVHAQQGEQVAADKELSQWVDNRYGGNWRGWRKEVASFLLGRSKEADLLAAASRKDDREQAHWCEAWYYAGMKRLLAGDKSGATDCFRKSTDTKSTNSPEYALAIAELKALQN